MDSHFFQAPEESRKPSAKGKIIKVIAAIFVILGVSGISFLAGKSSKESNIYIPEPESQEIEISPTDILTPTIASQSAKLSGTTTPSPTPFAKTKILLSNPELDGYRTSNGGGNTTQSIKVGRDSKAVYRGFLTFDITDIPKSAEIVDATLRVFQVKTSGNPYSVGGNLKVDHLIYGDSLDSGDYGFPALTTGFANLSTSANKGWKELDVTQRLKNDLANTQAFSQFRVHFQKELTSEDLSEDFAYFESADNSEQTKDIPQLVVRYY